MSAVVDASVLVAGMTDFDADGVWAERILALRNLMAPHLALAEATNVLRRLELARHLGALEASEAARDLVRLGVELVPFEPFADRVWELRSNLTCYDAWYVAVAEELGLPLATLDRRLAAAPGPRCRFLLPGVGPQAPSPTQ